MTISLFGSSDKLDTNPSICKWKYIIDWVKGTNWFYVDFYHNKASSAIVFSKAVQQIILTVTATAKATSISSGKPIFKFSTLGVTERTAGINW